MRQRGETDSNQTFLTHHLYSAAIANRWFERFIFEYFNDWSIERAVGQYSSLPFKSVSEPVVSVLPAHGLLGGQSRTNMVAQSNRGLFVGDHEV